MKIGFQTLSQRQEGRAISNQDRKPPLSNITIKSLVSILLRE